MLISRSQFGHLNQIIQDKLNNQSFSLTTQYKLLKLEKIWKQEQEIYQAQYEQIKQFLQQDEKGNYITNEDGGYVIKQDSVNECKSFLYELENLQIQVPDIYFSLDEFEGLNLTLSELEYFEPFIK